MKAPYERKGHRESSRRRRRRRQRVEPIAISENGPREREGEAVARSLGLSGGAVRQLAEFVLARQKRNRGLTCLGF